MFDAKFIINANKALADNGELLNSGSLHSAFSSLQYVDDDFLKACYIARSVLLNHPFVDGNKRTAFFLLCVAAENLDYKISINNSSAEKFVVSAVVNKWNPEKLKSEFLKTFVQK